MLRLLHLLCSLLRIKDNRVNLTSRETGFNIKIQIRKAKNWFKNTRRSNSEIQGSRNTNFGRELPALPLPTLRDHQEPDHLTFKEVDEILRNLGYRFNQNDGEKSDFVQVENPLYRQEYARDHVDSRDNQQSQSSKHAQPDEVRKMIDNLLIKSIYEHNAECRVFVNGKCATPRMMRRLLESEVIERDYTSTPVENYYVNVQIEHYYVNLPDETGDPNLPSSSDHVHVPIESGYVNVPIKNPNVNVPNRSDCANVPKRSTSAPIEHDYVNVPIKREHVEKPIEHDYVNVPIRRDHAEKPIEHDYVNVPIRRDHAEKPREHHYVNVPIRSPSKNVAFKSSSSINADKNTGNNSSDGRGTSLAYNGRCRDKDADVYEDLSFYQQKKRPHSKQHPEPAPPVEMMLGRMKIDNSSSD